MVSLEFALRILGMIVGAIIGWLFGDYLTSHVYRVYDDESIRYIVVLSLAGAALGLLITPWLTTRPFRWGRSQIREISPRSLIAGSAGLAIGLIFAALLYLPLSFLPAPFGNILPIAVSIFFGYLGITAMVMRQQDLFNTITARLGQDPGERSNPVLLDTSVIIDGRIADISQTGFLSGPFIIPSFVLDELQHIADSADALRRNRGRRGLEMLNRLRKESIVPIEVMDVDLDETRAVDAKLVQLARRIHAPILTNDYNLNRVAELQGVVVLNINELANAVKAVVIPGESMRIRIIQEGKEVGQGVGYLDDGTMVVVESGRSHIGDNVGVIVTRVLQTVAGRMIFAHLEPINRE